MLFDYDYISADAKMKAHDREGERRRHRPNWANIKFFADDVVKYEGIMSLA